MDPAGFPSFSVADFSRTPSAELVSTPVMWQRGTTRSVNNSYSQRLYVGGDRALVVHFTSNAAANLAPAEQLSAQARVAIPALCNFLYFGGSNVAVVYLGKTRDADGSTVGIADGKDLKQRVVRILMNEVWPPLRTDTPADDAVDPHSDTGAGSPLGAVPEMPTGRPVTSTAAMPATTFKTVASVGDFDGAPEARADGASDSSSDHSGSPPAVPATPDAPGPVRRPRQLQSMQALVYVKPAARGTHYVKIILCGVEKLRFDVTDARDAKHRWENRRLHTRILDSLETEKGVYSYAEYEAALKEACRFADRFRNDRAERAIERALDRERLAAMPSPTDASAPDAVPAAEEGGMARAATTWSDTAEGDDDGGEGDEDGADNASSSSSSAPPTPPSPKRPGGTLPPHDALPAAAFPATPPLCALRATPCVSPMPQPMGGSLGVPTFSLPRAAKPPGQPRGETRAGRVQLRFAADCHYRFFQRMQAPESATLDYKSYFHATDEEIDDRAVKFMCGFLNAYGKGRLIVGVHEMRSHELPEEFTAPPAAQAEPPLGGLSAPGSTFIGGSSLGHSAPEALPVKDAASRKVSAKDLKRADDENVEQIVVGAAVTPRQARRLCRSLTRQLHQCVPPVPPDIVRLTFVPVRFTDAGLVPASCRDAADADAPAESPGGDGARPAPKPQRSPQLWPRPQRTLRVLVLCELASTAGAIQKDANHAIRLLGRFGLSLCPLGVPVPSNAAPGADTPLAEHMSPLPAAVRAQAYAVVPFVDTEAQALVGDLSEAQAQLKPGSRAAQIAQRAAEARRTAEEVADATPDIVEFDDGKGEWWPYDNECCRAVLDARARDPQGAFDLKAGRHTYTIDLRAMTQANVRTGKARPIRIRPRCGHVPADASAQRPQWELQLLRYLNTQRAKYHGPFTVRDVPVPQTYVVDISVDLRRLPERHPLLQYRKAQGKFFNGWPSLPVWDPLSHAVYRAPRAYQLLLRQRRHERRMFPGAVMGEEWWAASSGFIAGVVVGFLPQEAFPALRLTCWALNTAVERLIGRELLELVAAPGSSLYVAVGDAPFGAPSSGMDDTDAARRVRFHEIVSVQRQLAEANLAPAVITRARRRTKRMSHAPMPGPAAGRVRLLPLLLCWAYEHIGALPAPWPYQAHPATMQAVRVAPHLATLFTLPLEVLRPEAAQGLDPVARRARVPAVVLDCEDGLLKLLLPPASGGQDFTALPVSGVMCDASATPPPPRDPATGGVVSRRRRPPSVRILFVDEAAAVYPDRWRLGRLLLWLRIARSDDHVFPCLPGCGGDGAQFHIVADTGSEVCGAHLTSRLAFTASGVTAGTLSPTTATVFSERFPTAGGSGTPTPGSRSAFPPPRRADPMASPAPGGMPFVSPLTHGAPKATSCFDCQLHRAEAEWAQW